MSDENFESFGLNTSSYGFSAIGTDDLESSEYTIVTIALDTSGSVYQFEDEIVKCMAEVVKACRKSPRADNLMLRVITFDNNISEVHGFKLLANCNPDDYKGIVSAGGMTALIDATVNAIEAASQYGKTLKDSDYEVNGLMVVVTDGHNNSSTNTTKQAAEALKQVNFNEHIDGGLHTILVGVNNDTQLDSYLQDYKDEVGITQYVGIGDADENSLAKLADFISKSVSSQSQALATGGPSQSLSF